MKSINLHSTLALLLTTITLLVVEPGKAQAPFTPGNIVVFRAGDGSTTLSTTAVPAFLDEYTPAGVLVQSIPLPTAVNGQNKISTTGPTTALGGGWITRSQNGQYIVTTGYNSPVGTANVTGNTGHARVIGLVDYNANINTTTALTDYQTRGGASSAVTTDGSVFWAVGTGSTAGGVRYTTLGSTTSTQLNVSSFPISFRYINIFDNQLYVSPTTSSFSGVMKFGTGLPTAPEQAPTALPGFPLTGGFCYQFVFADFNSSIPGVDVLYVANESAGIEKYVFDGTNWILQGTVGADADDYRGLTASISGTNVTLFATRNGTNSAGIGGGELVSLQDNTGYSGTLSGTPTLIASVSGVNLYAFRGVALAPQAPSANVSAKVFLQGAYNSGLGRHKDVTSGWASILNANALNQPFNTAAFGNYAGTESVSNGFFTSTGATTDILDWVLVELRNSSTPSTIVARQAAFVREDGQIVGLDGSSAVSFTGVADGNYYLVVRHRNHLGVRSSSTIALAGGSTASYDFTTAQSQAFQDGAITTNPAMKDLGGVFGLWGGNANSNTNVRFTGLSNDAAAILAALSANQAAVLTSQYNAADVNLDGTIRYTGLNNDAAALLSVLGSNQAAVFTQHQ